MTDPVEPKAVQERGFFYAVLSDENGVPDESNLLFLGAGLALIVGAFLVAFGNPFPLTEFSAAICALIPLYKAARGDWRGESNTAPGGHGTSDNTAP